MSDPAASRAAHLWRQASGLFYHAGAGVAAALAVLLFQNIFWADSVHWLLRLAIAVVAAVSAASPPSGLLIVAGISPVGYMLQSRVADAYPGRTTEAIAIAFLAGAAARGVTNWLAGRFARRRPEPTAAPPPPQFLVPVAIFGAVAVASCIVHYNFMQVWQDRPGPFFARLVDFLLTGYHGELGNYAPTASDAGFRFIFQTAFVIEGVALFLAALVFCSRDRNYLPSLVRMLVAGAVGAASFSFYALASAALSDPGPLDALPELLARRWTMFTPKLNSAASLLVLAGPIAIGAATAAAGRGRRAGWAAAVTILVAALWINGTRVALLAAILVLAGTLAWLFRGQLRWRALPRPVAVGLVIVVIGLAGTTFHRFYIDRDAALSAVNYRLQYTETALRMFASAPVFGIGIDQYYLQSERFAPETLLEDFPRVSAHNAFLQHAGELGAVGVAPFTWIIGAALWTCIAAIRRRRRDPYLLGATAGVTAFLITTLSSGHPLLLEVTAYPFWIALGLAAGRALLLQSEAAEKTDEDPASRRARNLAPQMITAAVLLLAVSIPLRVAAEHRRIDFRAVTYGLYDLEDNGRDRYRWTSDYATLYIDGTAAGVELPLRAPLIDRTGPMQVEIHVDGRLANRVDLTAPDWRSMSMLLPPTTERYHTLDLRVAPTWVPKDLLPGSTDHRELGVMLGEVREVGYGQARAAR